MGVMLRGKSSWRRTRRGACQAASDEVYSPSHYTSGKTETIEKIMAIVDGLPARDAVLLANIVKYADRCDLKGNPEDDLEKANNYAHMLCYGKWRDASTNYESQERQGLCEWFEEG